MTFDEIGRRSRLIGPVASRFGVPSLDLPHAEAADPHAIQGAQYDMFGVFGRRAREVLMQAEIPDDKIREIGPARFDALIGRQRAPLASPRRVVFASQWLTGQMTAAVKPDAPAACPARCDQHRPVRSCHQSASLGTRWDCGRGPCQDDASGREGAGGAFSEPLRIARWRMGASDRMVEQRLRRPPRGCPRGVHFACRRDGTNLVCGGRHRSWRSLFGGLEARARTDRRTGGARASTQIRARWPRGAPWPVGRPCGRTVCGADHGAPRPDLGAGLTIVPLWVTLPEVRTPTRAT